MLNHRTGTPNFSSLLTVLRLMKLAFFLSVLIVFVMTFLYKTTAPPKIMRVTVFSLSSGETLKYLTQSSGVFKPDSKIRHCFRTNLASMTPWPKAQQWDTKAPRNSQTTFRYPQCQQLLSENSTAQEHAHKFMADNFPVMRTDDDYIHYVRNCSSFLEERGYIMDATEKERAFPLAFSILFYRDLEQMERLLRAIYRPHNLYCIHLDKKSPYSTWQALRGIVSCFPNVFMVSDPLTVVWGEFSVLEPELVCMRDLWANKTWRYFINLTGQEFPLKTNLQLVNILTALNGSNDVDCTLNKKWNWRWIKQLPAPHNIKLRKGNVHIAVTRGFVDYVLHSPVAQDLLTWFNRTAIPDESFFSSVNHNLHLGVLGAYQGFPETNPDRKPYLSRFKNWGDAWVDSKGRSLFNWNCHGKRVRQVCIFGVGDLPLLTSRWELFANKFFSDFEPLALDCLEEWLWNVTMDEYSGRVMLNTSFYENLDMVTNHIGQFDTSWHGNESYSAV